MKEDTYNIRKLFGRVTMELNAAGTPEQQCARLTVAQTTVFTTFDPGEYYDIQFKYHHGDRPVLTIVTSCEDIANRIAVELVDILRGVNEYEHA
jgi:hypothetical protein